MKNNRKVAAALVAFLVAFGWTVDSAAQAGGAVGGFKKVAADDAKVIVVAKFAADTQASKDATLKLVSVLSAEMQLVAGSNYRLCLAVNSGGTPQQATAVVFANLQNESELVSWTPGQCSTGASADPQPTPTAGRQILAKDLEGTWDAGGDLNIIIVTGKIVQRVLTELAESTIKNFEIKAGDIDFVGVMHGNVITGSQTLYMFPDSRQRCPGLSSTKVRAEMTLSADGKTFDIVRDDPHLDWDTCQWTLEGRKRVVDQMTLKGYPLVKDPEARPIRP